MASACFVRGALLLARGAAMPAHSLTNRSTPCTLPPPACSIAQRLFDMRVAQGSEGLDIIALVEQQPALLLQADTPVSSDEEETAAERLQGGASFFDCFVSRCAVAGMQAADKKGGCKWQLRLQIRGGVLICICSGLRLSSMAGLAGLNWFIFSLQAWQHGLVSDNSTEWARRFGQLQQYVQT